VLRGDHAHGAFPPDLLKALCYQSRRLMKTLRRAKARQEGEIE
jgi:hypothetical protein